MIERSAATLESNLSAIAAAFVAARQAGVALPEYPGIPPEDLATAYAIQDCALSLWNRSVGGWKVGRIPPPACQQLAADRLAGPIFADTISNAQASPPAMTIFAGGFGAGEAEFMLRLAPPVGGQNLPKDDAQTLQWVDEVRIGIEIASSPYARINADGPCVTVSDQGNNASLVLGMPVAADLWGSLNDIMVETLIDGERVGMASAATMLDGPLGAVRFLLGNLAERKIVPQAGWWVSSGAVTGVHEVTSGQIVEARFEGVGMVGCTIL